MLRLFRFGIQNMLSVENVDIVDIVEMVEIINITWLRSIPQSVSPLVTTIPS